MGRNKKLRKDIKGEIRVINKHLDKIAEELEKAHPNHERIAKWQKDIAGIIWFEPTSVRYTPSSTHVKG